MISMALLSTMRELSQEEIAHDFMVRNGRVSFSQAFTEANAGTDASAVKTTVSLEDGGIYLDGRKSFVSNTNLAAFSCVLLRLAWRVPRLTTPRSMLQRIW